MSLTIARQMFAAEVLKLRRQRALMAFAGFLSVGVVVLFFGYLQLRHASNPSQYGPGLDQAVMDQLAFLQKYGAQVQQAAKDSPAQWQRWWWVCVGGQIAFLFFIGLMVGRWSPKKAREDAKAHEEAVNRELASLAAAPPASAGATA